VPSLVVLALRFSLGWPSWCCRGGAVRIAGIFCRPFVCRRIADRHFGRFNLSRVRVSSRSEREKDRRVISSLLYWLLGQYQPDRDLHSHPGSNQPAGHHAQREHARKRLPGGDQHPANGPRGHGPAWPEKWRPCPAANRARRNRVALPVGQAGRTAGRTLVPSLRRLIEPTHAGRYARNGNAG
jgi:hypothetical protein